MRIYYTHSYGGAKGESRRLLAEALCFHCGSREKGLSLAGRIERDGEHGKPYIEGFECFSISHSRETWAVLIGERECGLDIQYAEARPLGRIADRFYAPCDAEAASAGGSEVFFRLWARREALVKAAGTSVAAADTPPVAGDTAEYENRCWKLCDIFIPGTEGLYAAVCMEVTDDTDRAEEYSSADCNETDTNAGGDVLCDGTGMIMIEMKELYDSRKQTGAEDSAGYGPWISCSENADLP